MSGRRGDRPIETGIGAILAAVDLYYLFTTQPGSKRAWLPARSIIRAVAPASTSPA
jgi:hypothetical protein